MNAGLLAYLVGWSSAGFLLSTLRQNQRPPVESAFLLISSGTVQIEEGGTKPQEQQKTDLILGKRKKKKKKKLLVILATLQILEVRTGRKTCQVPTCVQIYHSVELVSKTWLYTRLHYATLFVIDCIYFN